MNSQISVFTCKGYRPGRKADMRQITELRTNTAFSQLGTGEEFKQWVADGNQEEEENNMTWSFLNAVN